MCAFTGLPLCVDTENTTPRHVEHTLSESLPIKTHFLIKDEEKTTSKHLDHTILKSLQKDVILEDSVRYASGARIIYNLSNLAVVLSAIILKL